MLVNCEQKYWRSIVLIMIQLYTGYIKVNCYSTSILKQIEKKKNVELVYSKALKHLSDTMYGGGGGFFGRFITLSFMEFKRTVIGEMCNKHYKLVVTVSILCYNGVFRTSFTSHCKCTIKRHQLNGKGISN